MSRTERYANLAGVVVPFAGVVVAIVLLWQKWVDVTDLAVLAVCYFATALGVTVDPDFSYYRVLDGFAAVGESAATDREFKKFVHELQVHAGLSSCTFFLLSSGISGQVVSAIGALRAGLLVAPPPQYERALILSNFREGLGTVRLADSRFADDLDDVQVRLQVVDKIRRKERHYSFSSTTVTPVSKVNTALLLVLVTGVLAKLAFGFNDHGTITGLIYLTGATTIASGAAYLVRWGRGVAAPETET